MEFLRRISKIEGKNDNDGKNGNNGNDINVPLNDLQKPLKRPSMTKILYGEQPYHEEPFNGEISEVIMKSLIGEFFDCCDKRINRLHEQKDDIQNIDQIFEKDQEFHKLAKSFGRIGKFNINNVTNILIVWRKKQKNNEKIRSDKMKRGDTDDKNERIIEYIFCISLFQILEQLTPTNLLVKDLFVKLEKLCFKKSDATIKKNNPEIRDLYCILIGKLSVFRPTEIMFVFNSNITKKGPTEKLMGLIKSIKHFKLNLNSTDNIHTAKEFLLQFYQLFKQKYLMKILEFKMEVVYTINHILSQIRGHSHTSGLDYTEWNNTLSVVYNYLWNEKISVSGGRFKTSKYFFWIPLIATVLSLSPTSVLEKENETFMKTVCGSIKKERNAKEFTYLLEGLNIMLTTIVSVPSVINKNIVEKTENVDEISYPILLEFNESLFFEKKNYLLIISNIELCSQIYFNISLHKINFVMSKIIFPAFEEIPDKVIFEKTGLLTKTLKFMVALSTTRRLLKYSKSYKQDPKKSPSKDNHHDNDPRNLSKYKKKILYTLSGLLINFDSINSSSAREDKIYIALSSLLIECIPDSMPLSISENQLVNFLAKNLVHPQLGRIVEDTFQRLIEERQELRPPIIGSVVDFVLGINDNKQELIPQLRWLSRLLDLWSSKLKDANNENYMRYRFLQKNKKIEGSDYVKFNPSKIEAMALTYLCSSVPYLRGCALKILENVRDIDKSYNEEIYESYNKNSEGMSLRVISVIEEQNNEIINQLLTDFRFRKIYNLNIRSPKDLSIAILALSDNEQHAWTYVLGSLFQNLSNLCPVEMSYAKEMILPRIAFLIPNEKSSISTIHLWANYCTLLCSCGLDYSDLYRGEISKNVNAPKLSYHPKLFDDILNLVSKHDLIFHNHGILILSRTNYHLYTLLFEKLEEYLKDKEKKKRKAPAYSRKLEFVSTIYSISTSKFPYNIGSIAENEKLKKFYLTHIKQLHSYLPTLEDLSDTSLHNLNMRYNFCEMIKYVSEELGHYGRSLYDSETTDKIFHLLSKWSRGQSLLVEDPKVKEGYQSKSKKKDDYDRVVRSYLDYIEHYSIKSISSLLKIPWLMDIKKDNTILNWINEMLERHHIERVDEKNSKPLITKGPIFQRLLNVGKSVENVKEAPETIELTYEDRSSKRLLTSEDSFGDIRSSGGMTSRTKKKKNMFLYYSLLSDCLTSFLLGNYQNKNLIPIILDECYYNPQQESFRAEISGIYLNSLTELFESRPDIYFSLPKFLNLVVSMFGNQNVSIRRTALKLLQFVASSKIEHWCEFDSNAIDSRLDMTIESNQLYISKLLAEDFPILSSDFINEMTIRITKVDQITRTQMLNYCLPWIEKYNLSSTFPSEQSFELNGNETHNEKIFMEISYNCELYLLNLTYLSLLYEQLHSIHIQKIWRKFATELQNVPLAIDFLLRMGQHKTTEFISLAKKIVFFMAKTAPQICIDSLVSELEIEKKNDPPEVLEENDHLKSKKSSYEDESHKKDRTNTIVHEKKRVYSVGSGATIKPKLDQIREEKDKPLTPLKIEQIRTPRDNKFPVSISNHPFSKAIPDSSFNDTVFPRGHFALILLTELSFEKEASHCLKQYIAVILQQVFLGFNYINPTLHDHCRLLLLNLIHSLVTKAYEENELNIPYEIYEEALSLEEFLKAKQGNFLFDKFPIVNGKETVISKFVLKVLRLLSSLPYFQKEGFQLSKMWAHEALNWAINCPNAQLQVPSFEIYRALNPTVNKGHVDDIIEALQRCFEKVTVENNNVILQILFTLRSIVDKSGSNKLTLFTQIFWAAAGILHTEYEEQFSQASQLLLKILEIVSLSDSSSADIFLASIPKTNPVFRGIQPLVLRGLWSSTTEKVCLKLLTIFPQIPELCTKLIDSGPRILANIMGLLPHLSVNINNSDTGHQVFVAAERLSNYFKNLSKTNLNENEKLLGVTFQNFANKLYEDDVSFLKELVPKLQRAFFPTHSLFVLNFIFEMLDKGPPRYNRFCLNFLCQCLQYVDVSEQRFSSKILQWISTLEMHIHSDLSNLVLTSLELCINKKQSSEISKIKLEDIKEGFKMPIRMREFTNLPEEGTKDVYTFLTGIASKSQNPKASHLDSEMIFKNFSNVVDTDKSLSWEASTVVEEEDVFGGFNVGGNRFDDFFNELDEEIIDEQSPKNTLNNSSEETLKKILPFIDHQTDHLEDYTLSFAFEILGSSLQTYNSEISQFVETAKENINHNFVNYENQLDFHYLDKFYKDLHKDLDYKTFLKLLGNMNHDPRLVLLNEIRQILKNLNNLKISFYSSHQRLSSLLTTIKNFEDKNLNSEFITQLISFHSSILSIFICAVSLRDVVNRVNTSNLYDTKEIWSIIEQQQKTNKLLFSLKN